MGNRRLTLKQLKFVREYLRFGDGTKAVKLAGYDTKHAGKVAYILLENVRVQAELKRRARVHYTDQDVSLKRCLTQLARMAFSDMNDFAQWNKGKVEFINSEDLTPSQTSVVQEISQKTGNTDEIKLKLSDRQKALDRLMEYLKDQPSPEDLQKNTIRLAYSLPGKEGSGEKEWVRATSEDIKNFFNKNKLGW